MTVVLIVIGIALIVSLRLWFFMQRRRRKAQKTHAVAESVTETNMTAEDAATEPSAPAITSSVRKTKSHPSPCEGRFGDVGLVAGREIKERLRGRIFRVGTIVMLVGVGAAVVIPALHKNSNTHSNALSLQKIGVVGSLSVETRDLVLAAAAANQDKVVFVQERSVAEAKADLKIGKSYLSIIGTREVLTYRPASSSSSPADASLVQNVAAYLGVVNAYKQAGLSPTQAAAVTNSKSVPVHTLAGNPKSPSKTTSIIGLVLLFFMLTQYCTWTLIGVMQEKSSRVVEVLLAMVRPIQLLGGKVLGIGVMAMGQAALVVGFALALGAAVGSDLLKGTAPMGLLAELVWLVLGYAFYCWVYAAVGSTAERQDQVQTLALPLSLPILFAYIFSITVATNGQPNLFFDVLAYLPPTAPFCMSVLVALNKVAWWQFTGSVLISLVGTAAVAVFAARIYRRAVLQTGGRVRFRELLIQPDR